MENQSERGGWGRTQKKRIPKRLRSIIKPDAVFPLESSWCTVMAISTLNSAYKYVEQDSSIEKAIKKGFSWIKKNQDDCGGWRDVDIDKINSSQNKIHLIQTGIALSGLQIGIIYFNQKNHIKYVRKGIRFLEKSQNKKTGGWPSVLNDAPDSKATSICTIACLLAGRDDLARKGVEWLITRQKKNGDWGYRRTSDSFLYGVYYGISTLQIFRMFSNKYLKNDTEFNKNIEKALRKALFWYEKTNELIKKSNVNHWGWKGGDKISDIGNTACALIVLLDYSELDFHFLIDRGVEYLLKEKDNIDMWGGDTSLVVYCLIKYCYPESRLENNEELFE